MAETKRQNFFGFRETHVGYLAPKIRQLLKRVDLLVKKGRRFGQIDPDRLFVRCFDALLKTGWTNCLSDFAGLDRYVSIAATPEGYSLGGRVALDATVGWLVTPPTSPDAENQLVRVT